jgi:hypothetical protein
MRVNDSLESHGAIILIQQPGGTECPASMLPLIGSQDIVAFGKDEVGSMRHVLRH